jgi:hypothetical protein
VDSVQRRFAKKKCDQVFVYEYLKKFSVALVVSSEDNKMLASMRLVIADLKT